MINDPTQNKKADEACCKTSSYDADFLKYMKNSCIRNLILQNKAFYPELKQLSDEIFKTGNTCFYDSLLLIYII